jgi:hypothetical protein
MAGGRPRAVRIDAPGRSSASRRRRTETRERLAGAIEAAEAQGPAPEGVGAVEVAADEDARAGARRAAGLFRQLQGDTREGDDVVGGDDALVFLTEDLIEIYRAERDEGRGGVSGGAGEGGVESGMKWSVR